MTAVLLAILQEYIIIPTSEKNVVLGINMLYICYVYKSLKSTM